MKRHRLLSHNLSCVLVTAKKLMIVQIGDNFTLNQKFQCHIRHAKADMVKSWKEISVYWGPYKTLLQVESMVHSEIQVHLWHFLDPHCRKQHHHSITHLVRSWLHQQKQPYINASRDFKTMAKQLL